MLDQHTVLDQHDVGDDPVPGQPVPGVATMQDDVVALRCYQCTLVAKRCRKRFDKTEESIPAGGMCALCWAYSGEQNGSAAA